MIKMEQQTQMPFWILGGAIATALFHNIFSAIFGIPEPIFITLTTLLVLAFIVVVIINIATYIANGKPKDIWKMFWLGLFGILGIFSPGLYGFFGFFAFIALKKK